MPTGSRPSKDIEAVQTLSPEVFLASAGAVSVSDWLTIDQKRIDTFADATEDHQFIHVDPERAARTPMGTTIAHGFLTLSLLSHFVGQNLTVPEGYQMTFNYGLNKVRFLEPVPVNSRVRAQETVLEVTEKREGHYLVRSEVTVEIEGHPKPALVAESLMMHLCGTKENER